MDSSKNIIDISTDDITTAIRLPDNIPRLYAGALFASDGVLHMLPGQMSDDTIADADGNILDAGAYLNSSTYRTDPCNKVWSFNLESQKWDVGVSGIEVCLWDAAVAFDAEKQVGWYYGGWNAYVQDPEVWTAFKDLYRLDKGKGAPARVETDSSSFRVVREGELVYIQGVGEAGILVLLGSDDENLAVSIVDKLNSVLFLPPC